MSTNIAECPLGAKSSESNSHQLCFSFLFVVLGVLLFYGIFWPKPISKIYAS